MSRTDPSQPSQPLDPRQLGGLFAPPQWLREFGMSSWYLVGIVVFTIATISVLALTQTIVLPVITASVIAAVASPLVRGLTNRGLPRGAAAAILLVALIALVVGVVVMILTGVTSELSKLGESLGSAKDQLASGLADIGVSPETAKQALKVAAEGVTSAVPALLGGVAGGLVALSSIVFFLSLTVLSLFFLLKDGHEIRNWSERHMRVSPELAHEMTGRVLQSLHGYFVGVTLVAAFNAVVVGAGALILGIPQAGAIVIITFLGAYIPYLGAWGAGAFAVLIALGSKGTDAALTMTVIQLLANGILQQLIQPVAYGAALGIHPLAVLIVTIAGGALFGGVGLILAAPLTSAAARIAGDIQAGVNAAAAAEATAAEPEPSG